MNGFLFDENGLLLLRFAPALPVVHATALGPSPTDADLWRHATSHGLAIVSKDADFVDRILASSPPPWSVHLKFGNLLRAGDAEARRRGEEAKAEKGSDPR